MFRIQLKIIYSKNYKNNDMNDKIQANNYILVSTFNLT